MNKYLNGEAYLDCNGCPWSASDVLDLYNHYVSKKHTDEEFNRIADKFFILKIPSKSQCEEFLRDCRGMLYGDSHIKDRDSWTVDEIAQHFKNEAKVQMFYDACIFWQLTERQGGGLVI